MNLPRPRDSVWRLLRHHRVGSSFSHAFMVSLEPNFALRRAPSSPAVGIQPLADHRTTVGQIWQFIEHWMAQRREALLHLAVDAAAAATIRAVQCYDFDQGRGRYRVLAVLKFSSDISRSAPAPFHSLEQT
jgi:hypothetical protein